MTTETTNTAPEAPTQYTPERVSIGGPRTSVAVEFTKDPPQAPQQEAPKAEPDLILGKFKSQDDLAAAYKELEKKLGQPKSEEAPKAEELKVEAEKADKPKVEADKTEEPKAEESKGDEEQAPKEELKDEAGKTIDVPRYEQEFLEKGTLTEESYKELAEKHNLPKDIVDDFIAMRLNKAEGIKTELFKAAGGEDNLNAMLAWAREPSTDGKIGTAYDAALDRAKTPEDYAFAISGLRAQFEQAKGIQPQRIVGSEGSASGAPSGETFGTEKEWRDVLRSHKYKTDGAYRQQVNQRAMNSSWFKIEA